MAKHEWRKKEKGLYLPKAKPELIDIPTLQFFTIKGEGSPEDQNFSDCVSVLYALSYAVKMNLKKEENPPKGYVDYAVYPLEGIWDLNEEARKTYDGIFDKKDLVYTLMIRQPDFVDTAFASAMLQLTQQKKPHPFLEKVQFEKITDGPCIQMLHLGPFENEPESFAKMEAFAEQEKQVRLSKAHREIYLSDFRKVAPEKLKTVLRFKVKA